MSNRINNSASLSSATRGRNENENAKHEVGRSTRGSAGSGALLASSTTAMAAAGNATPTSLDSPDSNSDMDGIEWDDESGDEENLGLLFWDEIPPVDNTTTSPSTFVVNGHMGRGGGTAHGEDNEIPIINPGDQSAEYMGELLGMQQNVDHGPNSNVAVGPPPQGGGGDVQRTSPGPILENLIAKSIPNTAIQSRDVNTPRVGDAVGCVLPPTNCNTGGAAPPATTVRGADYADLSSFFPSPSCGSVPSLLEVQDAHHQQQALGVASSGLSALKVAATATGGGGGSVMLPSLLGNQDVQTFLQVPNSHPPNSNDQWAIHQLQQLSKQQLSNSMNSLPSQLPSTALNQPPLGAVAPTSPHPYLMWLLHQQQQQPQHVQTQLQANIAPQIQALSSNINPEGASASSSVAQMSLNQLQLLQLLQLQQQQQQVQTVATHQQQQSTLMQASSEQLQPMQSQLHQHQSVVTNSGATQGWLGNPLPQQPQLQSPTLSAQAATQLPGKRVQGVANSKDATTFKRKRPNQNQSQRKERPQKTQFVVATAAVAYSPPGGSSKQSASQDQSDLPNNTAPTVKTMSTITNLAPTNSAVMPLVSASDTEGGGQLEWMSDHSQKRAARGGSISPNYFYTSPEECSGTEDHLKFATEEQRVQYNRERNREHAKNTRIRKKAFVEQLKISVDELCRERDSLISERAMAANLMVETHSKRVDVLRSVFALRAGYGFDQKRELWSSILDESSFTCRLPVTPYQSFPSSEVQVSNCQRTIVGVDAMISDAASNYVFLDSIVDRAQFPDGKIKFQYTLVTEESVVAGNQLMARWAMSTINAKKLGANTELHQSGMLICKFNTAHKIVALEIMFDVMAFMLQVKMAMGFDNFNDVVIPNTVQTCSQKVYDYPMVMTLASRPYTIVQVNDRWEKLTGYTRQEVVGKHSCSILQGRIHHAHTAKRHNANIEEKNKRELDELMGPLMFQRPSCAMLTNYTKLGRRYRQYVTIYPLSTDSNILHYFGLTTFVQWMDDEDDADDIRAGESNDVDNIINGSPSFGFRNDGNTIEQMEPHDGNTRIQEPSCSSGDSRHPGGGSTTSPFSSSFPSLPQREKQSSNTSGSNIMTDTDQR